MDEIKEEAKFLTSDHFQFVAFCLVGWWWVVV